MAATVRTVVVTANYTAWYGDCVLVDATAGAVAVTLPLSALGMAEIIVKKIDASSNAVTVNRSGSALIDGSTNHPLTSQFALIRLVADGTNWQVTGGVTASATVPGPPTGLVATGGNGSVSVAFTAPTSNGGSPVTGYTITTSTGQTASGTSSPIVVTGCPNGTAATATGHATNAVGNSVESAASNSYTPSSAPTVPSPPTMGTAAVVSSTSASVAWTAPASDGGSAITGYEVKTYRASDNSFLFTDTLGVVLTFTRTGLTTGTGVYFKIAAINAVNTGAQSAASNTVTPSTPGASDNFNRADEEPLSVSSGGQTYSHPNVGHFAVVGNKAVGRLPGTDVAFEILETGLSDFTLTADVNLASGGEIYIFFRCVDTSNYWHAGLFAGFAILTRHVAGVAAAPGGFPSAGMSSGPATIKIVCAGDSIQMWLDIGAGFVLKHDITDSSHQTATKAGLTNNYSVGSDTTSTVDNFLVVP